MEKSYEKLCPACGCKQTYKNVRQLKKAIKNNTTCKSCKVKSQKLWMHSNEWKLHLEYEKNPPVWSHPCPKCNEIRFYKTRPHLMNAIKKNSVCRKCQLIIRNPTIFDRPNYNPKACDYFDKLSKEKGWNLQHALNGGEF